ncbi:MAG: chemotaxis protein CheW [Rhodocyclaceae bacterium]|nr:chemotaxis protein CheW [Rhodocyclaceae bacterium]
MLPLTSAYNDVVAFQEQLHRNILAARTAAVESLIVPFRSGDLVLGLAGRSLHKLHQQVGGIVPVIGAPRWVRGGVALGGDIYTAIDLGLALGGAPVLSERLTLLVVADDIEPGCAILADEVLSTTKQTGLLNSRTNVTASWLHAYTDRSSQQLQVVDIHALCSEEWFRQGKNAT